MPTPRQKDNLRLARPSGMSERLVAAFMLGLALFTPPLLAVFSGGGSVAGVPLLFVYVFGAWICLTVALALIIERAPPGEPMPPPHRDGGEGG